jgi:hypothetical protein
MENDLDTPSAIQALADLAQAILQAAGMQKDVRPAQESLRGLAHVFGLTLDASRPDDRVVSGWQANRR